MRKASSQKSPKTWWRQWVHLSLEIALRAASPHSSPHFPCFFCEAAIMVSKAMYDCAHIRSIPAFHLTILLRKASCLGKQRRRRWLLHSRFECHSGGASSFPMLLLLVPLTACPRLHARQAKRLPPSHPPSHCSTLPHTPQQATPDAGGASDDSA